MSKDDTAVNDEVAAESTATGSAPEETKSEVADPLADDAFDDIEVDEPDDDTDDDDGEDTPEPAKVEETKPEEQPQGDKPVDPKDEWDSLKGNSQERFRNAINERNEAQRRIAELEAKQAQFATEQELLNEVNPDTGEYYTPQEIERISWQQSRQTQAEQQSQELYQLQVQQNQATINDEAMKVTQEFGLLNPNSKDYSPEIAQGYAELLSDNLVYVLPDGQQANRTTLLQNGINPDTQATLVGYNTSPYKLAKSIANSYTSARTQGETLGQVNAQRATEKMLANVDTPSNNTQHQTKNSELDDFDKAWDEFA